MPRPEEPTDAKPKTTRRKPRRGWFRRLIRGFLWLLLIVAIFHRPLIEAGLRLALIKVALRENIQLDVHFSGSIFTNLTIENIRAVPTGNGPSPVEKIAIDSVHLEYSIPNLIRHGIGEFLRSYEIKNADLVFVALPSKTEKERAQKKSLAEDLNNILGQPALYADRVLIENFNITVKAETNVTAVKGVNLFLHPWKPGYFKIKSLEVPGLPAWRDLSAVTSYAQRNLFFRNLVIAPEIEIEELNFDASQRAENKGSLSVKAKLFGGSSRFSMVGTKLDKKGQNLAKAYDTRMESEMEGIDIQAAAKYFHAPAPPVERLAWMHAAFAGEPEEPRTWRGDFAVRVESIAVGAAKIDAVEVDTTFADGTAKVASAQVSAGRSVVLLQASAQLPESINDFSQTDADATYSVSVPALEQWSQPLLPERPVTGEVAGQGKASLRRRHVSADLEIDAKQLASGDAGVDSLTVKLHATKPLDAAAGAPPTDGLDARVTLDVKAIRSGGLRVDSAMVEAVAHNDLVRVERVAIARDENTVEAKGTLHLPSPGQTSVPMDAEFAVHAPKLETFGLGQGEQVLSGHMDVNGKVSAAGGQYSGGVQIDGGDLAYGGLVIRTAGGKINVANNEVSFDRLALVINDTDQIAVTGKAGLQPPYPFEGALLVLFKNLAVLQPLARTFGVQEPIAGALDVSVETQGKGATPEAGGQFKVSLTKAKYGKIDLSEFTLAGLFGPNYAETSEFRIAVGETRFQGGIEWRDDRLRLKDIDLRQGGQQALTGFVLLPFEPQNPKQPIPFDKRIAVNVNANKLDLEKLLASVGQTAPGSGNLSANFVAGGTILQPALHLKVAGRDLKSKAAAQLQPAELDVTVHYSEKQLTLDAAAREPGFQPLTVKGEAPIDLEAAITKKTLDPNLPIDVTVKMAPSSLAVVPKLVPSVRSLSGTVGIDTHVTGTVLKPRLSGAVNVRVEYARLANEGAPNIGAMQANLAFTENSITFQQCRGDIGGGDFNVSGRILFPKLTEPVFALDVRTKEMLAKRDDSITVRLDTDLHIVGPLAAGKVYGSVFVTQSRFFREIDILPIALPGRPKPEARSAPSVPSAPGGGAISLPPLLSKWTFDIAIKTRADDPFQIRSNLAMGKIGIDLKFGGTGAKPFLDGNVRIDSLTASLPFSKLEVRRGFITFSRDAFLQPKIDLLAESEIRDYRITANIYGSATDPQVSLTSQPPLPQGDIISLLATGTTLSELTGKGDVLASRAAILLIQQLYQKIFKQAPPSSNGSMMDRFTVDAGAVDSRTGRQEVSASMRLVGQLYLVGGVDVTGAFAGRLKYLIRFR